MADKALRRQRPVCSGSGIDARETERFGHAPCPVCGEETMPVTDDHRLYRHRNMKGRTPMTDRTCDHSKESRLSPVPHDYEVVGEDYGSLGDGGSYERLKCRSCGRIAYSAMADWATIPWLYKPASQRDSQRNEGAL